MPFNNLARIILQTLRIIVLWWPLHLPSIDERHVFELVFTR